MNRTTSMTGIFVILLTVLTSANLLAHTQYEHGRVLTAEEESRFVDQMDLEMDLDLFNFRFGQTTWRECDDYVTGNYTGYGCSNRRMISKILKSFMEEHIPSCVQEAMNATEEGRLDQLHIIHDGILGDRRHSPRSLHAENRAIDIRSFLVTKADQTQVEYVYRLKTNRKFFTEFRKCWGKAVHEFNGCPLIRGQALLTGSIGWEDRNHQNHLHTSVPYCVSGNYGSGYFRR